MVVLHARLVNFFMSLVVELVLPFEMQYPYLARNNGGVLYAPVMLVLNFLLHGRT